MELPEFRDEWRGRGIDQDEQGYIVVYGDAEHYALTPQRYETYNTAVRALHDELYYDPA